MTMSTANKLPEDCAPIGELTEAILSVWRAIDASEAASGRRADLGVFATTIGCQPQAVWVWLTRGRAPGPRMAHAMVRVLPAVRDVFEVRGLLDERRRVNRGERGYALMSGRAQTSQDAEQMSAMRKRAATMRARKAQRLDRIKQRARALGMERHA
jgi:hypothetical protein